MRKRHTKTALGLFMVCLFFGTSIVPAVSINLNNNINDLENNICFYKNCNKNFYENYSYLNEKYLDNHSRYSYYDVSCKCHEYLLHFDELENKKYITNQLNFDDPQSQRPDFENGTTWYVDDIAGESPNNPAEDFIKIQDAINASKSGDTIYVYRGEYIEKIFINTSIILEGEDRNFTKIDAVNVGNVITVHADWAHITGFDLRWSGFTPPESGIYVTSNFVTIYKNHIRNNRHGITLDSSSYNLIFSNILANNYNDSIFMQHSSNFNNINNNTMITNGEDGINIDNSSTNFIFNNEISRNSQQGIKIENHSNNNKIISNSIVSNAFNGIIIKSSSNYNKIIDNQLEKNNHNGVHSCHFSNNNYLVGNTILYNRNNGIFLSNSSYYNTIDDNTIRYNSHEGVLLTSSSYNILSNNKIWGNHNNGIYVNYSSNNNTFFGNNIERNDFTGLLLQSSNNNSVILNEIQYNYFDGIKMMNSSKNNTISDNQINQNRNSGIEITDSSDENIIIGNRLVDNQRYGILITFSVDMQIQENICQKCGITITGDILEHYNSHTIEKNSANGKNIRYYKNEDHIIVPKNTSQVILANCNHCVIRNLNISNVDTGIQIHCSSFNTISRNVIFKNGEDGILLSYKSNNNVISYNNITDNQLDGISLYGVLGEISHNSIRRNIVSNNAKDGIVLDCSTNNIVEYNKVTNNQNGIRLDVGSNSNLINGNICSNNSIDGIGIFSGSKENHLECNNCTGNMKGITIKINEYFAESDPKDNLMYLLVTIYRSWLIPSNNYLIKNTCKYNHQGILLNSAFNTEIMDCDISRNGVGIFLYTSYLNTISKNKIEHNNHKGFSLLRYSMFNNIVSNKIGPLNYQGIYIEKSHFNTILNNDIIKNNDDGIGLVQSHGNKIQNNNIFDNTNYAIEGTLCFDNARNNYWGEEPPKRWIFSNEEEADIYTPGGFVTIKPYLREPVDINN